MERVGQGTALVDEAGSTMSEVVDSIRRVTDMMGDISSASNEQAAGVAQVGEAVTSMDQTTQQNAALVEQIAAAASSLKAQAGDLVQTVSVFKLAGGSQGSAPALRAARPAPKALAASKPRTIAAPRQQAASKPAPARALPKPAAAPAKAQDDGDWETF